MKRLPEILTYFFLLLQFACVNSPNETTPKQFVIQTDLDSLELNEAVNDSIHAQPKDTIQIQQLIETYKASNGIDTMVNGSYESIFSSPKFSLQIMDTISATDFSEYKALYDRTPRNTGVHSKNDSVFWLETSNNLIEFPSSFGIGEEHYFSDVTSIPKLHSYSVVEYQGSGGQGSATFWLIDSLSNKIVRIISDYDNGYDQTMVSMDGNKLVCLANDAYNQKGATLKIMTIAWGQSSYQLSHLLHFQTKEWCSDQCYMIDNDRLTLRVFNNFDCYYKASIDSNYTIPYDPEKIDCSPVHLLLQIKKHY